MGISVIKRHSTMVIPFSFIFICVISSTACFTVCSRNTFGNQCEYQCHCANGDVCDPVLGICPGPCDSGFFGPACQYYASTFKPIRSIGPGLAWLFDNDDKTCNNGRTDTITVLLDTPHPITWIRVVANDSIQLDHFQLAFQNTSRREMRWKCPNPQTSRIDGKTMDILCKTPVAIKFLTVSGPGVLSLCSLHISAGRNVALKQATSQNSDYSNQHSKNAVDGRLEDPDDLKSQESTCSVTVPTGEDRPWWMVKFSHAMDINQILLYNRRDRTRSFLVRLCAKECEDRLVNFTLWVYPTASVKEKPYHYKDPSPKAQDVYTVVPSPKITWPASRLTVQGESPLRALSLCEVIVLGETVCPQGKFGRECEHKCNCADEKACFVSTGGCPTGCAPGFTGEGCMTECDKDKYGPGCAETCSMNCAGPDKSCRGTDGLCLDGCEPGYKEPLCKDPCEDGTYGPGCSRPCNVHCAGDTTNTCDHISGECHLGCDPGFYGLACQNESISRSLEQKVAIIGGSCAGIIVVIIIINIVSVILWRRTRRMKANFANDATISSQVEGHLTHLAPGGKPDHQSPYANDAKTIGTSVEGHVTYLAPSGKPDHQSPYANDAKTIDTSTEGHMTYLAPGGKPDNQSPYANDVISRSNGSQLNSNSRSGKASVEPNDLTPQEASTNHYDALQRSERDSEVLHVYNEGFDHYDLPVEATGGREPSDALPLVPTVCPPGNEDTPGYVQLLDERENPIFDVDARGYSKMDCSPVPVGGETTDSEKHVYSNGEEEREVYVNV